MIDIEKLTCRKLKEYFIDISDSIGFAEIGFLFDYSGPEIEFFKTQILVKGLKDFHIIVAPGLTLDEKREAVIETIASWDFKGKPRIEVQF